MLLQGQTRSVLRPPTPYARETAPMINFAALEENIATCMEQQKEMSATLRRLETTVATLASKNEMDDMESRLNEQHSKTTRALEKLDVAQQAAAAIVHEMPQLQRDLTDRMALLEQRLTADLSTMSQTLGGRLSAAEGEVRARATKVEVDRLHTDVGDRATRDDADKLQTLINKVRDECSDRIDSIAERSFGMRKELDASLERITGVAEIMQRSVGERTSALEDQASKASELLAKAERQIGAKVSNDELNRVTTAFSAQVQETRNVLQAQMDVVRARAERSTEDFQRVVGKMDAVAMRIEVAPLSELAKKLQQDVTKLEAAVQSKAAEEDVAAKLDEIVTIQREQKADLDTKADALAAQERHEQFVRDTGTALSSVREATEHLGISINSVEESVGLVAAQTSTKADTKDVDAMMKVNETVQDQIASLKKELQGTLKALETWILEQNTKKSQALKLQPKPSDTSAPAQVSQPQPSQQSFTQPPPGPGPAPVPAAPASVPVPVSASGPVLVPPSQQQAQGRAAAAAACANASTVAPTQANFAPAYTTEADPAPSAAHVSKHSEIGWANHTGCCSSSTVPHVCMQSAHDQQPQSGAIDEQMLQRVGELERQLAETQALVLMHVKASSLQGGERTGMPTIMDGAAFTRSRAPVLAPPANAASVQSFQAPGTFKSTCMVSDQLTATPHFSLNQFAPEQLAPPSSIQPSHALHGKFDIANEHRLPSVEMATEMLSPRAPLHKKTGTGVSHLMGGLDVAATARASAMEMSGPPFRSQNDRRQWLLQEKRRWLIEMRLGGQQAGYPQPKLPPLASGMDISTVATPRP